MAEWRDRANCLGLESRVFFDDVFRSMPLPKATRYPDPDQEALDYARSVCAGCAVRRECFREAMEHEAQRPTDGGNATPGLADRFGVFGGTTPPQRHSLWRRDSWQPCRGCGESPDPLGLIDGEVVCECGTFSDPPVEDRGDQWYPRHDNAWARLLPWILENTKPGDRVDPPSVMGRRIGYRHKGNTLAIVFERLVADGILGKDDQGYVRLAGRGAVARWVPPAKRGRRRPAA